MTATQGLRAGNEAVSPVIGVILMVAITVVVAGVVFVLVSGLTKNSSHDAANIAVSQDKATKTLTVVRSDPANWEGVRILIVAGSGAGCTGTDASGAVLGAVGTAQAGTSKPISASDRITITDAIPGQVCTVQLTYAPTNQLLDTWTFNF